MNLDSCTPGQYEVITTLDKPMMVSAGAGSGKTFTLTQRIAYALTEPSFQEDNDAPLCPKIESIDEVLAITYTKKAAAELKSRIKGKLLELGSVHEALKVDDAWISTIHGMCSRILREHALDLGIDPSFSIISDTESQRLRDQAFNEVVFQIDQSDDSALKNYIHELGIHSSGPNAVSLERYVESINNKVLALPGGFDSIVLPEINADPSGILRQMIELGETFAELVPTLHKPTKRDATYLDECNSALEQARAYLEKRAGDCHSFTDPTFDVRSYARVFFAFSKTSPKYRVKDTDPTFFAEYRSSYAQMAELVISALAVRELHWLIDVSKRVQSTFNELKGPTRLDNTDLLRTTYRSLEAHPDIAAEYRDRFSMIMIDEFQDTDELQVAILSLIAQSDFSNVCTVGDAQQSIYRFRGADVSVFYAYREMLERRFADARFVNLPDNFRSHSDVLSFVSKIFSQPTVFGERFLSLQPKGAVNFEEDPLFDERPRVEVALFDSPQQKGGLAAGKKACAEGIADHFAELRTAGASPSDMALLLGSMSNVGVYMKALRDRGFECLVSGGSTFSSSYEVGLIQYILRYFSDQLDDEALYQILSSPIFQITDAALLYLATRFDPQGRPHRRGISEGFLTWPREHGLCHLPEDDKDSIDFAYRCLSTSLKTLSRAGLTAAIKELLRASGWFIRLEKMDAEGQAIVGNIQKALRLVYGIEREGLGVERSTDRFIHDCATLKLSPGTLSTTSSDFVQIMTVHSSKGLEFPHVAVAEVTRSSSASSLIVENIQGSTYFSLRPRALDAQSKEMNKLIAFLEPFDGSEDDVLSSSPEDQQRALKMFSQNQELLESRRLFYVALTRASRSLYVGIAYKGKMETDYTGTGILDDLYTALRWEPSADAPIQMIDYGGSAPLRLSFTLVEIEEDSVKESRSSIDQRTFLVPCRPPQDLPFCVPDTRISDEVCSYSSLSKCGGALVQSEDGIDIPSKERLLDQDAFSAEYSRSSDDYLSDAGPQSLNRSDVQSGFGSSASVQEHGMFEEALDPESDTASDLGTAFHRLAQNAIDARDTDLFMPDENQISVQCRALGLSFSQEQRLKHALSRWFSSDLAHELSSHPYLFAEVPFMVAFREQGTGMSRSRFLEGEIDALACDVPLDELTGKADPKGPVAYLVDYKTGGTIFETEQEIYAKHLLQAQCYAYALLSQGFSKVKACFVRVEQEDRVHLGQPQVQRYEFGCEELQYLETLISESYKQIRS